jgi:hypothetical protein
MLPDINSQKIRLRELKLRRKRLWEQFEGNPNLTHLAAELKIVDDLIVMYNQLIHQHGNNIDDYKREVTPQVEQLFLLLSVSQREQSYSEGGTRRVNERRTARRYDLSLSVSVLLSAEKKGVSWAGKTRDISSRGVYFTIDNELNTGAELDLAMALPDEVTGGAQVFICAVGKVVRSDKNSGDLPVGIAVAFEVHEIVRNEAAPSSLPKFVSLTVERTRTGDQ